MSIVKVVSENYSRDYKFADLESARDFLDKAFDKIAEEATYQKIEQDGNEYSITAEILDTYLRIKASIVLV